MKTLLRLAVIAGCVGGLNVGARAQDDANIGVRTKVTDHWVRVKAGQKNAAEGGHGKVYGLLAVDEIKSGVYLVKPVDVVYLKGLLLQELAANGFRPYAKGENPDILLTMSYGRGYVNNPYFLNASEAAQQESPDGVLISRITGADASQLIAEKSPGYEQKLQRAQEEKLFIRVTAWEFPKDPKAKPNMLWKTVIVAGDPMNRDLNNIAAAMLAAGAPLFDKETNDREIDLYRPVPTGRVNVGAPEVVGSDVKKTN